MIETVIDQVAGQLPPIAGDNLLGFRYDVEEALRHGDWCHGHSLTVVEEPRCLLRIELEVAEGVASLQELTSGLVGLWTYVAYKDFEASSIRWYREAAVLRFVTINPLGPYFVAGRVRVAGAHYEPLAEAFERRFHALKPDPLGSSGDP